MMMRADWFKSGDKSAPNADALCGTLPYTLSEYSYGRAAEAAVKWSLPVILTHPLGERESSVLLRPHCALELARSQRFGYLVRMILVKRVYEPRAESDGARFLVDRLWPRGAKKEALALEGWLKDLAPSDGLRKWFNHDPSKWSEFQRRYFAELDENSEIVRPLLDATRRGKVTLLFGARDAEHNNAVALKRYLSDRLKG